MEYTERMNGLLHEAYLYATNGRFELFVPEHLLLAFMGDATFRAALMACRVDANGLERELKAYLEELDTVAEEEDYEPDLSFQFEYMRTLAANHAMYASRETIDVTHFVYAMMELKESTAAFLLNKYLGENKTMFLSTLISMISDNEVLEQIDDNTTHSGSSDETEEEDTTWRTLVTCMNDTVDQHNPLIGREQELERTIQVLCRKDKNNPLHVGEPGVGKTALVYGLAARIEHGEVPERLEGSRIYQMDMGTMLAGTQFRGDFEKRIKQVMDGVEKEGHAIVYIDEIHNMIGAGRTGDGGPDASNMLKPYLERGDIRFIGSTTYEEFNRHFARQRGIVRRFQQIDIPEPSVEDTIEILKGLRPQYESFHNVTYSDDIIEYTVRQSARLITDRQLPDKAIDLIDEAGAYLEMTREKENKREGYGGASFARDGEEREERIEERIEESEKEAQPVTRSLITDILAKVCKVDAAAMKEEDNSALATLSDRMLAKIYGQNGAVDQVVEAIQMAKAGLLDDDKPLASLLFVGPTGVGKTEVARQLANELGVQLVRFDMSEYTERHAVAKLIGSPAGYVGYEDGGLLTDAIRKTPNCVLLLDEIEKAHQDIYNILLQVMDYARLTDNRGQKADFRNVVLIMTSNAGAQYASQANIGFQSKVSRGEAMMAQVKRTFKPEFLNRLSGTVVFRDMDEEMASMILDKKLRELEQKLKAKNVTLTLNDEARAYLLEKGFTREYGAREMDRVIGHDLKPLLMREILFGQLQKGGEAQLCLTDGELALTSQPALPETDVKELPETI